MIGPGLKFHSVQGVCRVMVPWCCNLVNSMTSS